MSARQPEPGRLNDIIVGGKPLLEHDVLRRIRFAIFDPGAVTPRGDDYAEQLHAWQARAIAAVLPEIAASPSAVLDRAEMHLRRLCPEHGDLKTRFADCNCDAAAAVWRMSDEARITAALPPGGEPEPPRSDRSRWQAIADALNAVAALGIDLDGTITDHLMWSVIWDREAERWVVDAADERDAQTGGESGTAPLCRCGHGKAYHDAKYSDPQCRLCPEDGERMWRHPYIPAGGAS
ncbi:hypothetical protein [Streptomyces synnematoformans]|uniref:Uncharacterized protein n=1 Tax=Streptomyces synnematoformans TaxID=415721 RepID=A0ABP5J063_9ACTN